MGRKHTCREIARTLSRWETSKARHSQQEKLGNIYPIPNPEQEALGCQQLQKVATPTSCPPPTSTRNAFETLKTEEVETLQPARWAEKKILQPPMTQPRKKREGEKRSHTKSTRKVDETPAKEDLPTCAAKYLTRPHKSSYFLPHKAAV